MLETRILLVEDNPADADFIRTMLETAKHGPFQVHAVDRLSAALDALNRESYEIILLDLGLPDSAGLAALHAIRQAHAHAIVVVLTGNRDDTLVDAALADGAQDYIQKRDLDADLLDRVLRYSVQRIRTEHVLRDQGRKLADAQGLAQVGSWEFDFASGRSDWSDEAFRTLGYEPGGVEPSPEALTAHVHPDDRHLLASFEEDPWAVTETESVTYRIVHPDGGVRWVETRISLVRDETGHPLTARGTAQDVTPRVQAEGDRRRSRENELEVEKLTELDELKTLFLNSASHELNNPLTPLKVQTHLLLNGSFGPLAAPQRQALEVMSRSIARLVALARDVLDSSRIQGGRLNTRPEPTDIATILADADQNYGPRARARGVTLTVDMPSKVIAYGDPVRLAQVVTNLVDNAIKFTPKGGTVSVAIDADGDDAHIRIQDTGIGLSEDQIDRLFQPFSQVHEYDTDRPQGTGLGLYISKGIMQQHGGDLWVESRGPGTGSTFHATLPLVEKDVPVPSQSSGSSGRPVRVSLRKNK